MNDAEVSLEATTNFICSVTEAAPAGGRIAHVRFFRSLLRRHLTLLRFHLIFIFFVSAHSLLVLDAVILTFIHVGVWLVVVDLTPVVCVGVLGGLGWRWEVLLCGQILEHCILVTSDGLQSQKIFLLLRARIDGLQKLFDALFAISRRV